jgi:hypothetical protein
MTPHTNLNATNTTGHADGVEHVEALVPMTASEAETYQRLRGHAAIWPR